MIFDLILGEPSTRVLCFPFTRRENARVLQRSRPAGDLTLQDEEYVLNILSFSWREVKMLPDSEFALTHYCLRVGCPLGCNRRRDALVHVEAAVLLVAGGPVTKCLEYRWKAFDQASAFAYRAREVADLLRRGFSESLPKKMLEKAEAAADAARAADQELAQRLQ